MAPLGALPGLQRLHIITDDMDDITVALAGLPPSLEELSIRPRVADWDMLAALPRLRFLTTWSLAPPRGGWKLPETILELDIRIAWLGSLSTLVPALASAAGAHIRLTVMPGLWMDNDAGVRSALLALAGLAHVRSLSLHLGLHALPHQLRLLLGAVVLPQLAPALRSLNLHVVADSAQDWSSADSRRLVAQLSACRGLEAVGCLSHARRGLDFKGGGAELVRALLAAPLPRLRNVDLDMAHLLPIPAIDAAALLRKCLAARVAAGLPPLRLSTRLLTPAEARSIQAELQAAGAGAGAGGGYEVRGTGEPRPTRFAGALRDAWVDYSCHVVEVVAVMVLAVVLAVVYTVTVRDKVM